MDDATRQLRRRQALTVALMVFGYAGYYACRSDLSVCLPLIADELTAGGTTAGAAREGLGRVVSIGILAYALGKPFAGPLADSLGGRRNFLAGMGGAVVMTMAFTLGGALPVFGVAWAGNRLVQSLGWAGLVKVTSRWFGASTYGTVMGVLSLSYLFGDAAARYLMGRLIAAGLGWQGVFLVAAGSLAALFLANARLLVESPAGLGLPGPPAGPATVYGGRGTANETAGVAGLLGPLLRSPAFWLVCLLSCGLTLLREAFNTWTPTYFVEGVGLSRADAGSASALFPFTGGLSVLLVGVLGDRFGRPGRAAIILLGLGLTGLALALLGTADFRATPGLAVFLVAVVAFCLLGPYSYLAGAIALDLGGRRGGATASGFIDFAGYLGGAFAGWGLAKVSLAYGWKGLFLALAGVAFASALVAALYLIQQRRADGSRLPQSG